MIEINKGQQHILPGDQHKRKLPSGRKTVHKESKMRPEKKCIGEKEEEVILNILEKLKKIF